MLSEMATLPPTEPEPRPEPSAQSWAQGLRNGEPRAVERVRERVGRILAYRGLRISRQDLDDLQQEVLVQIWRSVSRPDFDSSAGFWGFVELVAARRCIDWLRTRKHAIPPDDDLRSSSKSPFEHTLGRERASLASAVLARLHPDCRRLITLRLRDGLPYSELAPILGVSEGALRVRLYRCIGSAQKIVRELQ